MSTTDAAASDATPSSNGVEPAITGSVDDLIDALGMQPEKPATDAKETPAAKTDGEKPAADAKADGDEADGEKDKAKAEPEEDDAEVVKGILARSAERRRQRKQAQAGKPAPAATAAPPAKTEPAKAAEPAKPAAAAKPETPAEVRKAVEDILGEIKKLADEDEAKGAADQGAAERKSEMTALRGKLEEATAALGKLDEASKENVALKERIERTEAALQFLQDAQFLEQRYAQTLDAVAADVPTLAARRDATGLLHEAALKFSDKYKVAPDLKELARRIEKKLKPAGAEKTDEKPDRKARPTLSSDLGSPPAARQGPDKRGSKDAERDFFDSLGVGDD